ncbi:hypothetical protein AOZ06_44460 [Kibdelosporangium phytohabitans]|uniref:Chaplin domain-containing protein n=1 Tax=Kibdelosporangium phytohabitans TaxID=860235 RepID=A0A0N9I006_9PSEU|nr:hypothetical protein AOZ06_44460 [Kibdelosporangium phytohabitans]
MLGAFVAAMLCQAGPAFADHDEDVLSGFDGDSPLISNVSVAPIQMCGSGVFLTDVPDGVKTGNCTNAPTGNPLQQLITNSTIID